MSVKSRRVGERERKVYEEKKTFAGKVNKIAKMIARMVDWRALQLMVTELERERKHPVWIGRARFRSEA